MRFDMSDVELLNFTGWPHWQHHVNYLFRTDPGQKWTNRYTQENLLIVGESVYVIGKDLEERQKTAKAARKMVRDIKADYSDLRMCCIYLDEKAYSSDAEVVEDVIETMQEMNKYLAEDGMKVLFGVIHADQGSLHFHLVAWKFW